MKQKILVLAIFPCFLTACDQQEEAEVAQPSLMKINVVQPQAVEFSPTLTLAGTWVAKEDVAINPALQNVQILAVNVDAGSAVKQGQVLAVLENNNVQSQLKQNNAQLARAKANLASQQASLTEAQSILKRYQILVQSDSVSRQELEQQRAKADTAKAAVNAAKAEITQIQAQLADSRNQRSKAEIVAPADGIITQRNAEVGTLTGSNALFHLAKDGVVELEVEANADEIALLEIGLTAKTADVPTSGQIRLIFPAIDPKTRLGKVRIAFADNEMPIGVYGKAEIELKKQAAVFALPFSAIAFGTDGKHSVMVVNSDGKVERKNIEIGTQYQGMVEVRSGVNASHKVVQKAAAFVDEGDMVEPKLVTENKER